MGIMWPTGKLSDSFKKLNVLDADQLDVVLDIYDLEDTGPSRPAMFRSLSQPPLEYPLR